MLLIATFMFEPAKLATNCVSASGASIRRAAVPAAAVRPAGDRPHRGTAPAGDVRSHDPHR